VEKQRPSDPLAFSFDLDWLSTLRKTHSFLSTQRSHVVLPPVTQPPSQNEVEQLKNHLLAQNANSLLIPPLCPTSDIPHNHAGQEGNLQTDFILQVLQKDHIWTVPSKGQATAQAKSVLDSNCIDIDDV